MIQEIIVGRILAPRGSLSKRQMRSQLQKVRFYVNECQHLPLYNMQLKIREEFEKKNCQICLLQDIIF